MRQKYTRVEKYAEDILARKARGETYQQIGESYGLTSNQVKQLIQRQKRKQRLIAQGYVPRPIGRPRKNPEDEEVRRKNELIQLRMQVELLRNFLSEVGRR